MAQFSGIGAVFAKGENPADYEVCGICDCADFFEPKGNSSPTLVFNGHSTMVFNGHICEHCCACIMDNLHICPCCFIQYDDKGSGVDCFCSNEDNRDLSKHKVWTLEDIRAKMGKNNK